MSDYEINDVGLVGLIQDLAAHTIAPEAFTLLENMRCVDGKLLKLAGYEETMASPSQAPRFIMNLVNPAQTWWLYASAAKIWVWDGSNHTDISRSGTPYTSSEHWRWNSTVLGGIPIVNNGQDIPQYWSTYNTGTLMANLSNWPSGVRARAIKALGPYLVAVYITKSGTVHPHMVKWSHPADPGALPASWDETDETKDAGEYELPDSQAGMLLTAEALRGQLYLYKEQSIWRMQPIGGQFIFDFKPFVETEGALSSKAVAVSPDGLKHVVALSEDIVIHDGQSVQSIITNKVRRELFKRIDRAEAHQCFMFTNRPFRETWFCYPEIGADRPTRALIWNQESGALTEATVGFVAASTGYNEGETPGLWSDFSSTTWQDTDLTWNARSSRAVIVANGTQNKLFELDRGSLRDGIRYRARAQRTNLAIMGQKRDRSPIQDYKRMKMYRRVWIKASGGVFSVRVGVQQEIDGAISWLPWETFNPAVDQWVDVIQSGRALAIEFASVSAEQWEVHGYKPEVVPLGNF